jgi:hypothetical protein
MRRLSLNPDSTDLTRSASIRATLQLEVVDMTFAVPDWRTSYGDNDVHSRQSETARRSL